MARSGRAATRSRPHRLLRSLRGSSNSNSNSNKCSRIRKTTKLAVDAAGVDKSSSRDTVATSAKTSAKTGVLTPQTW